MSRTFTHRLDLLGTTAFILFGFLVSIFSLHNLLCISISLKVAYRHELNALAC